MQCEIDSSPVTQSCMRACAAHLALRSGRAAAAAGKVPGYVHHQVHSAAQTASEDPVHATASTSHATMKPWPPSSLLVTHVILAVVTCGSRISPVRCQRLSYCRLERISWLRRHMQASIRSAVGATRPSAGYPGRGCGEGRVPLGGGPSALATGPMGAARPPPGKCGAGGSAGTCASSPRPPRCRPAPPPCAPCAAAPARSSNS